MADKKITAKIVVDVVTTGAKKALDGVVKTAKKVGSAVGGVLKGFGKLGVITAIGAAIGGAFSKNQKVVDAFNKVIHKTERTRLTAISKYRNILTTKCLTYKCWQCSTVV